MTYTLTQQGFELADLRRIWQQSVTIQVDDHLMQGVIQSRQTVEQVAAGDDTVYGVNTGFGLLAHVKIDKSELDTLQRNLVISHATGVGNPIDTDTTRLIMT